MTKPVRAELEIGHELLPREMVHIRESVHRFPLLMQLLQAKDELI